MAAMFRSSILCYHAISATWPDRLAVGICEFGRQIRLLTRLGYRSEPLDRVLEQRRGAFHVTFDDALRSIASALDVLHAAGAHATVFVCSAYADDGRPLAVPELAGEARRYPDELATMTWPELAEVSDRGFEIGSHTITHPHLTSLTDSELTHELRHSKERIEAQLGKPCRFVAYPYGEEDRRVRKAARAAGYAAGFGLPGTEGTGDRFAVPRVGVYKRDGVIRFAGKTCSPLARLRPRRAPRPRVSESDEIA